MSGSKTHAKHALDVAATKRRKGEEAGKKTGKAYHASHGTAQKRIKKGLKIGNKVSPRPLGRLSKTHDLLFAG